MWPLQHLPHHCITSFFCLQNLNHSSLQTTLKHHNTQSISNQSTTQSTSSYSTATTHHFKFLHCTYTIF
jgi:hypothetical protein